MLTHLMRAEIQLMANESVKANQELPRIIIQRETMDRDIVGDRLEKMSKTLDGLDIQLKQHAENDDSIKVWVGPRRYESLEGHYAGMLLEKILEHLKDVHQFLVVTNPPDVKHE